MNFAGFETVLSSGEDVMKNKPVNGNFIELWNNYIIENLTLG